MTLKNKIKRSNKKELTKTGRILNKTRERLINSRTLVASFNQDNQLYQSEINSLENSLGEKDQQISQQQLLLTDKDNIISQLAGTISTLQHDKQNLQNWKDNHTCLLTCQSSCCLNNDYAKIKTERDTYEQKIQELEQIIQELRDKPPVSPVNNEKAESNNSDSEKETLLNTIKQQQTTTEKLQKQLQQTIPQEAQVIVKEIPVENLAAINQLRIELKGKEATIKQLHLVYLLILGVSVMLLTCLTKSLIKKARKTKQN